MKLTATQALRLAHDAAQRFLTWWRAELAELGEEILQFVLPRMAAVTQLDLRSTPVRLSKVGRGQNPVIWEDADPQTRQKLLEGALAPPKELASPTRKLEVLLPESTALVRSVQLPGAAATRLRSVLELQYRRLMPLKRELVLFDHKVLKTDTGSGQMTVALATVRRELTESIAGLARLWGFRNVTVVVPTDAVNASFRFELDARRTSQAPDRLERALRISSAALAATLLVAALFGWKLHDLVVQRQIRELLDPATAAATIEGEIKARQEVAQALEPSVISPGFVQIVSELTKVAPDDAWIFQLSRKGYELQLNGEASQSSILALRLNESPLFSDVRLGGTTVAGSSYGRFEITLHLDEPTQ